MKRVKTWVIRLSMTPFMAVGGIGAGQIFTTDHPGAMPYAAAAGCVACLALCYAMYWRESAEKVEMPPTLEELIKDGIPDLEGERD